MGTIIAAVQEFVNSVLCAYTTAPGLARVPQCQCQCVCRGVSTTRFSLPINYSVFVNVDFLSL